MKSRVLSFLALVLLAGPAHADTVYTYTGDYFGTYIYNGFPRVSGVYTTADRITGSFTVADDFVPVPLQGGARFTEGVLHYSFTDGHQTLTEANSTGQFYLQFYLTIGYAWSVVIGGTPTGGIIRSWLEGDRSDYAFLDANNWGQNGQQLNPSDGSHRGTWTVTTVPEPMTLLLVVAGIGGIAAARACLRIRP